MDRLPTTVRSGRAGEEQLRALTEELAASRARAEALLRERNELLRAVSQVHRLEAERAALERQAHEGRLDAQAAADARRALAQAESANQELRARLSQLESQLAQAVGERDSCREAIGCLEAQVGELEQMVQMLKEHVGLER